jgi:chloramphenicol 3-O phosphotransferase
MPERTGRILLLNGASSSGKSSIGQALLALLPDPWFLVPIDAINAMRSTAHTRVLVDTEITAMLCRTRLGYHRAVAALASAGNDVIMDYPLSEQWRLADLLETLDGYDVTLVEVSLRPGRTRPAGAPSRRPTHRDRSITDIGVRNWRI